jgi:predicted dehydrogenase
LKNSETVTSCHERDINADARRDDVKMTKTVLIAGLLASACSVLLPAQAGAAAVGRVTERLDRGVVAVPAQGGGVLYDLGPHVIDQAIQLFGSVASVHAEIDTRGQGRSADDDVLISILHESGVRSRLSLSTVSALPTDRFRVRGTSAAYVVGGMDPQEQQLGEGLPPSDSGYGRTPESAWGLIGAGDEQHPVETLPGDYPAFYRGLAESIRGEGPLPVDPADSLEVLAIIEEAHASAEFSR